MSIGVDDPPGQNAFIPRSSTPPASSMHSRTVVPIGTSMFRGARTAPETLTTAVPGDFSVPHWRNHSTPLRMIGPAFIRVCVLLTTVGDA